VKLQNAPPKWLTWTVAAATGAAVLDMPYGYYQLLRLVVTGYACYVSYNYFKERTLSLGWTFAFVALLFNPLFVIAMSKEFHALINGVTTVLILFECYISRGLGNNTTAGSINSAQAVDVATRLFNDAKIALVAPVAQQKSDEKASKEFRRFPKLGWILVILTSVLAGIYVAGPERLELQPGAEEISTADNEGLNAIGPNDQYYQQTQDYVPQQLTSDVDAPLATAETPAEVAELNEYNEQTSASYEPVLPPQTTNSPGPDALATENGQNYLSVN
jgi:hypothetical protein